VSSPAEVEAKQLAEASLRALGLMVHFLQDGLLDGAVLPHAKFEALGGGGEAGGAVSCTPLFLGGMGGCCLFGVEIVM